MQYPVAAGAGINGDWRGECRQRRHGPGHQVTRTHVVGNKDPATSIRAIESVFKHDNPC